MTKLNFDFFKGSGMAVYNLDNPQNEIAGMSFYDAVLITTEYTTGTVEYQIARRDNAEPAITISSDLGITAGENSQYPQLITTSASRLIMVLPFRTEFKVRVCQDSGTWSDWLNFKTRDKRYQTADAITQLVDDSKTSDPTNHGNKTITVTNVAKAAVVTTAAGATVTNTDTGYSGTTSISYTSQGATVANPSMVSETSEGATVYPG